MTRSRGHAAVAIGPALAASLLLLPLTLVPMAEASVGVQPGNHDLGSVARGETRDVSFTVHNGATSAMDLVVDLTGEGAAAARADPAAFRLAAGGSRSVQLELTVTLDAAPGRHALVARVSGTPIGDGNTAVGAVEVQILYRVAAVDVAYVTLLQNATAYLRITNGHDAEREVALTLETRFAGTIMQAQTWPAATVHAAGARQSYWALDPARHPDGTYTLRVTGDARAPGVDPEPFDGAWTFTVEQGTFALGPPTPESGSAPNGGGGGGGSGGSGGGGGGGGEDSGDGSGPAPASPAGPTSTPAPRRILVWPGAEAVDAAPVPSPTGDDALPHGLSSGLVLVRDLTMWAVLATAALLIVGLGLFLTRARFPG